MRVLVTDKADPAALDRLRSAGHEVVERVGLQGDDLVAALDGCQALLVRSGTRVTGDVLSRAHSLRVVVRAGTGLDNVDAETARIRGIVVRNTPGANRVSVAELVFGLLIAFERHLAPASAELRAGRWERARYAGRELSGRTFGLIGLGRIGREVAVRARAFELVVIAYDPILASWPAGFEWVGRRELDALLSESDIISMHVPLQPGTRGLIGARELGLMKPDALIVNAARGGVIDEAALHAALVGGGLRGALLDVYAQEPPGASPLLALPNVLALPHLGASTAEAQRRAGDEAADVLIEALAELRDARLTMEAAEVIERLALRPLPTEGGWYRETYRSGDLLRAAGLPDRYAKDKSASTAILYLLDAAGVSRMHRLPTDELYHVLRGDPAEMLLLHLGGRHERVVLGPGFERNERPQVVVPAGVWQGTRVMAGGRWTLFSVTVAPGFDVTDYEHGERSELLAGWPAARDLLQALI